jgi:XTP/dITP diphosphohydrolase
MSDPAAELRPIVVATSNPGKLREIRQILARAPLLLRALDAFPAVSMPEEGDDYLENARMKAQVVAAATGQSALGDDSGLEVAGLGGAPGARSARFGGPDLDDVGRTQALLEAMRDLAGEEREARFVCVAALASPDGRVWTARGECRGRILDAPRGRGGFGYDPIFQLEGGDAVMAELRESQKNRVSHRARAFRALSQIAGLEGVSSRGSGPGGDALERPGS